MASCAFCTPNWRGQHQNGCPTLEGGGGRSQGKKKKKNGEQPGPKKPLGRFECPKGGQHVYGWRPWQNVNANLCSRERYCKKCNATTGRDNQAHDYNKGKCTRCGRS